MEASKRSKWLWRSFQRGIRGKDIDSDRVSSGVGGLQAQPPTIEVGGETPAHRPRHPLLYSSTRVAALPVQDSPPANTDEIFELDASQTYSNRKRNPSTDIHPVAPNIQEVTETFQSEPFLVPFSLYSYGTNVYPSVLNPPSLESWDLQLPNDQSCVPRLCEICRLVNTDKEQSVITHHDLDSLKSTIAEGCTLCRLIFEHAIKHNHVSTVKQWYSFGQPAIKVSVRQSILTFQLGPYLEKVFELYRFRDSCFQDEQPIIFREISPNPLGPTTMRLIQRWIDKCEKSHSHCRKSSGRLPTRLIDVSSREPVLVPHSFRLPGTVKYVALSHCWGKKHTTTTTKSNFGTHCDVIPMSTLAKSFCDAVLVTRTLGLKYLWIDSLCIIQDSVEDWQSESAIMGAIYQNAYLTISALSALDSHSGFLHPRPESPLVHLSGSGLDTNLYARPPTETWNSLFINAPLNKRAWALQERLLSRRVVHFSRTEIIWECCTCSTRESSIEKSFNSEGSGRGELEGQDFKRLLPSSQNNSDNLEGWYTTWYRIVQAYSRRLLTRKSDKLAAIAGMAALVAETTGLSYRHGLWEEDFRAGLLWRIDPSSMDHDPDPINGASEAHAGICPPPTWSWTSVDSKILYITLSDALVGRTSSPVDAQLLEMQTRPKPAFTNASFIYGNADTITLNALICPVILLAETRYTANVFDLKEYDNDSSPFAWATLERGFQGVSDVHAVLIVSIKWYYYYARNRFFFLLVVPGGKDRIWRRIGVGFAEMGLGPFKGLGEDSLERVDIG